MIKIKFHLPPLLFLVNIYPEVQLVNAQSPPVIEWQRSLGGSSFDQATDLLILPPGNIWAVGYTFSSDGDVSQVYGTESDIWLCALDSSGTLLWEKNYGGTLSEQNPHLDILNNGTVLLLAQSFSNDSDVTENKGLGDGWIVNLDTSGNILWQRSYGGSKSDLFSSAVELSDGSLMIAGSTLSKDGDISEHYGNTNHSDVWILWCDSAGNLLQEKNYGGTDNDGGLELIATQDGNFIVAAYTESDSMDVSGNHGESDVWIFKIDIDGNLLWQTCLGGSGSEIPDGLLELPDGRLVVSAYTTSFDGNISNNHGETDGWLMILDADGNLLWQRCYGGSQYDAISLSFADSDSTFLLIGQSESIDGDVTNNFGSADVWLIETTSSGEIVWEKNFGGTSGDRGYRLKPYLNNSYVMLSNSWSNDADVTGHHGTSTYPDYWVAKLKKDVATTSEFVSSQSMQFKIQPNPVHDFAAVQFHLQKNSTVRIELLDVMRLKLRTIAKGNFEPGNHELNFSINDFAEGIYFLQLTSEEGILTLKIIKQ